MKFLIILVIFISNNSLIAMGGSRPINEKEKNKPVQNKVEVAKKSIILPAPSSEGKSINIFDEKGEFRSPLDFFNKFNRLQEDEISLLWLTFPFIIASFILQFLVSIFNGIARSISSMKSAREKARDNFMREKRIFRDQWEVIRRYDNKILSEDISSIKDKNHYRKTPSANSKETVIEESLSTSKNPLFGPLPEVLGVVSKFPSPFASCKKPDSITSPEKIPELVPVSVNLYGFRECSLVETLIG